MAPAIPFIIAATTAISTVMAVKGARDAKKARSQQAAIEDQNRILQEKQTRIQLAQADREQRLRIGTLRAGGGARGGIAGSVIDIIGDTITQGFMERKFIAESGGIKAENFARSAELFRSKGRSEQTAGFLSAANTLLGGGVETYSAFQRV